MIIFVEQRSTSHFAKLDLRILCFQRAGRNYGKKEMTSDQKYELFNKLLSIHNYYRLIFINTEVNMWFLKLSGIKIIYFSIITNNLPLAIEERNHLTTNPTSAVKCNAFQLLSLPKVPH